MHTDQALLQIRQSRLQPLTQGLQLLVVLTLLSGLVLVVLTLLGRLGQLVGTLLGRLGALQLL
jgi:MFS superfamily sulfate permease-like transporter